MIFAAYILDHDPMQWAELPGAIRGWLQSAGGLSSGALFLFALLGIRRSQHSPQKRQDAGPVLLFVGLLFPIVGLILWAMLTAKKRWLPSERALMLPLMYFGSSFTGVCYNFYFALRLLGRGQLAPPGGASLREYVLALAGLCAFSILFIPVLGAALTRMRWARIWALARLSFKEALRSRVVLVFSIMVVVFLFADWFVPAGQNQLKNYITVVYWTMSPLFLMIASILGAFSIPNDIKNQSIHTIVTKPVEKLEIVLGRFLGFAILLTIGLAFTTAISYMYIFRGVDPNSAVESFKARVPLLGNLYFSAADGTKKGDGSKWENAGREWDYRSYITGPPPPPAKFVKNFAVWSFEDLPSSLGEPVEILRTQDARLTDGDPFDKVRKKSHHKVHNVKLLANKEYTVDLKSKAFDSFLRVENADGVNITQDNNSGGGLDSLVVLRPPENGEYRIIVTTFNEKATGDYELIVAQRTWVKVEFTFDIFRLNKGKESVAVYCAFTFADGSKEVPEVEIIRDLVLKKGSAREKEEKMVRARAAEYMKLGAEMANANFSLSSVPWPAEDKEKLELQMLREHGFYSPPIMPVYDYHTQTIKIPGELLRILRAARQNNPPASGTHVPLLRILVNVDPLSVSQMVGVARRDLYLLADERDFWQNFAKGVVGMWCSHLLVLGVAVACSTYLSGVISWFLTLFLYFLGWFKDYVQGLAFGKDPVGGGPAEAAQRLYERRPIAAPRDDTPLSNVIVRIDDFYRMWLQMLLNIIPDVNRFDLISYVANGFDISWAQVLLLDNFIYLAGYLLPCVVLSYYLMKFREIANPT